MQWWNLRRQPRRSRPGRRSNSSRWIHSRMPSNSEHAAYRYRTGTTPLFVAFAKAMVIAPRGAAVGQAEVATPQNPSRDGLSTTLSRSRLRGDGPDAPHSAAIELRHLPEARFADSGWSKRRELALLWFALQRLANCEQEDGTLVFCVGGKEVDYIIVEEGQPGRT